MGKPLDNNGLLYFWAKIKAILPKKTSELQNDSGYITVDQVPEGVTASNTVPKMAGTAAAGTEGAYSRGDHVHPSDTAKVDKVEGKGLSENDLTAALKGNYDAAFNHSQQAHAPANASTLAGYGITDAYTKTEVDQKLVSGVFYKGEKETFAELPASGNKVGDMWNIKQADAENDVDAGDNAVWNGSGWDIQGGKIDLSGYMKKSEVITNAEIDAIVAT